MEREILKVSSKTTPGAVAGAIAGIVREGKKIEMQAIGAGAVNQAVKATAVARGFLIPSGIDLILIPNFDNATIDGEERTVMKLFLEAR